MTYWNGHYFLLAASTQKPHGASMAILIIVLFELFGQMATTLLFLFVIWIHLNWSFLILGKGEQTAAAKLIASLPDVQKVAGPSICHPSLGCVKPTIRKTAAGSISTFPHPGHYNLVLKSVIQPREGSINVEAQLASCWESDRKPTPALIPLTGRAQQGSNMTGTDTLPWRLSLVR